MKAIIVDDEHLAREIIKNYVSDKDDIEVIAECSNGFDAVKEITEKKPDLVFLDIQMPKLNGFEMLELLDEQPAIIFTTAFDNYAIKAFEVNAVDYLLKPFSEERFNEALNKVVERIQQKNFNKEDVDKLIEDQQPEKLERIVVKDGSKISIIPVETLKWLEAQDDYVRIHSEGGRFMKKKTMKFFEDHLDPNMFIRIHRSSIININSIKQMELYEKDSYRVILKDDIKLPVSKTGLQRLKEIL
ncbi:MAG: DNA-binding response regulator [Ignavibacteria bacterium RBG_16_34_14]|nr:MAG: DNA-binding response regulator [Ignavibacteria bacterium RBG_16_34_14]